MFDCNLSLAKIDLSWITCEGCANYLAEASHKTLVRIALVLGLLISGINTSLAQDAAETHRQLTDLRDQIMAAYESRDFDEVLLHVHPDVVVTWQNGVRARGHAEVRKFYEDMISGKNRIVRDVKTQLTVDGLSVLHGDSTAVACGNMTDDFDLMSGSKFHLKSLWTASLAKRDNRWVITSFHVSSSIFDNPILAAATSNVASAAIVSGFAAAVVGSLLGFFIAKRR